MDLTRGIGIALLDGSARFVDPYSVEITGRDSDASSRRLVSADKFMIAVYHCVCKPLLAQCELGGHITAPAARN